MIKRTLLILLFGCIFCFRVSAQFAVSGHQLTKDGKSFFWLGDTAWELFHRLNREESDKYLSRRSEQGFTVVQAVALAEMDGLHTPNAYGDLPLLNDDPGTPNEKYFAHVDYVVDKANSLGITIALLPTWGDKVFKNKWGAGPEIFNPENAKIYGRWIATRYKDRTNLIWILGGDRNPRNERDIQIWRAMAEGILDATNQRALISYHGQPNEKGSAEWFQNEKWLSFNIFQNGHCRDEAIYDKIFNSYQSTPVRPVIDAEPIYEDHPVCFNVNDLGTSSAYDVRKYAYLDVFSGAFGHTYGCHDVWQMYSPKREGINGPHMYWTEALNLPGANQMKYLAELMRAYSADDRVPDQSIIVENNEPAATRIQALRTTEYLLVYTAAGKPFTVLLSKLKSERPKGWWLNPRTGEATSTPIQVGNASQKFMPPSTGYGHDWVFVVEANEGN